MLLLKKDIIKKKQFNKVNELLKPKQKFDFKNNKKYKVKAIYNNKIYIKKIATILIIMHFSKIINTFCKDHPR